MLKDGCSVVVGSSKWAKTFGESALISHSFYRQVKGLVRQT